MIRTILLSVIAIGVVVIAVKVAAPDFAARLVAVGPSEREAREAIIAAQDGYLYRQKDYRRDSEAGRILVEGAVISALDCSFDSRASTAFGRKVFGCAVAFAREGTTSSQQWVFKEAEGAPGGWNAEAGPPTDLKPSSSEGVTTNDAPRAPTYNEHQNAALQRLMDAASKK
jgi:hypothetical protein